MSADAIDAGSLRPEGRPLDPEQACLALAPEVPRAVAAGLGRLLDELDPHASPAKKQAWLLALFDWLRSDSELSLPAWAPVSGRSPSARLWLLIGVLESCPPWRHAATALVRSILLDCSGLRLFSESGLPREHGFFAEASHRLSRKLLPRAPEPHELSELLRAIFPGEDEVAWLDAQPPPLILHAVLVLTGDGPDPWRSLRDAMIDSVLLLTTRASAGGLAEEVRVRGSAAPIAHSPFARLAVLGQDAAAFLRDPTAPALDPGSAADLRDQLALSVSGCRQEIHVVLGHLEQYGVSVDLVFRLERMSRQLDRLEALLGILLPTAPSTAAPNACRLATDLVRSLFGDDSLRALVEHNIHQLARKIIERAGETGEHYITSSADEYHEMVKSAAGGGALTTVTTLLKFIIARAHLPSFFEGVASSVNYAGSFLVMHGLGFTLATKQPSMTAATLAGALETTSEERDLRTLVELIARIVRSQLAAAFGNIGMVIPATVLADTLHRLLSGRPFLTVEEARYVVGSLDPLGSGTIVFATLTGCFLWASSVLAGWLDNWAVYRRVPHALAEHPGLSRLLGERRTRRLAALVSRNISAFGGSTSLGIMLGMTAVLGRFFGLPVDVRHVTLSSGALSLAGGALGVEQIATPGFAWALLGILVIGTLNFGVSFALALWVALRARRVNTATQVRLVRTLFAELLRAPGRFLLPPKPPADPSISE